MIWQLKPKAPTEFIKRFPEYSPKILQLLFNRELRSQEKIDEFFNPDYEQDLHDPFLMLGVKEAVKRIERAIKKQEKIAIFGDYDCDGVCGAVILKTVLQELGGNLEGGVHIPNRLIEGYGLNDEVIRKMAYDQVKLVLTIDCGITDFDEVKLANSLGLEIIIIDHHQVAKKLPEAKIIIDPWQPKDKYPFKELAGAGVAFKLIQALVSKNKKIKPGWEKWLLDLVALATVADCMPLFGENRALVRYGLIVLAQTQRLGLRELMKLARLVPVFEAKSLKTNLDVWSLSFLLAPRLNAAGRIDHANLALELLTAVESKQAQKLSQKINAQNQLRQKITNDIVAEIESRIGSVLKDKSQPVIVEADNNWSPGVVGLVAGKICDRYHRPTIIFSAQDESVSAGKEEQALSRGSARSIPSFNILEAIGQCSELLKEFGGHPGAAGLSLLNKNLDIFKKKINKLAREKLTDEDLEPKIEIDLELAAGDINWELFDDLMRLEPFGQGNEEPIFLLKDMEINNVRLVGNGARHLKLELKSPQLDGKIFKAIGFGLADKNGNGDLKYGDRVDVIFGLIADEWNGTRNLQLKIIDIKKIQ